MKTKEEINKKLKDMWSRRDPDTMKVDPSYWLGFIDGLEWVKELKKE